MTRRDYIVLAELAKQSRDLFSSEKRFGQFVSLTADRLQGDNPRFNRHRFLVACGVFQGASK